MSAVQLDIHSSLGLPGSRTRIPQIGFGVYKSAPDKCFNSCSKALEAGYRHIDTAQYYENEEDVGRAIRESNVARKDVHITTKILEAGKDLESTYEKILKSVEKLDGKDGYVDLFLIHSPNFGKEARQLMWQALEKAKNAGKVLEIGVSNYGVGHIEEIRSYSDDWPPAVNQIEVCSFTPHFTFNILTHITAPSLVPAS
jgi:diketogulonate reductase-like aldo/keto reductase